MPDNPINGFHEGEQAYERGDYAQAAEIFRPIAEQGHADAQYKLGIMYAFGQGVPRGYDEGVRWLRMAAEQDLAEAQTILGAMCAGVQQDYVEAARWLRMAAEQEYAEAQCELGGMYANGQGVPQDYIEAVGWWRKAAEQGYALAQYNLGVMCDEGSGIPQDYVEAVRWFRMAAEQGYAQAQVNLGVMYDEGRGVTQDYDEAVRRFRMAAEQGIAEAQGNLGIMYDNGRGVTQDDAEAVSWYRKAAEQGFAEAQCNLGLMYEEGRGVPQNDADAVRWYRRATHQGITQAQSRLIIMYEEGRGVPQDDGEAAEEARESHAESSSPASNGRITDQDLFSSKSLEALAASDFDACDVCVFASIDDIWIRFVRTGEGIQFCITVPEDSLGALVKPDIEAMLLVEERMEGDVVIGRIWSEDGSVEKLSIENSFWPIVDVPDLDAIVRGMASVFFDLVGNLSKWGSLAKFLQVSMDHDVREASPSSQTGFNYWWLVGPEAADHIVPLALYGGESGVFIRPQDKLLPVFSSSLFAAIAAKTYDEDDLLNLTPMPIKCLGCFFNGSTKEIGRDRMAGAILNEEWKIRFLRCDEDPSGQSAGHFEIIDADGLEYNLAGCFEAGVPPVWIERKWADEIIGTLTCSPKPW